MTIEVKIVEDPRKTSDQIEVAMIKAREELQKSVLREISAVASNPEQIAKDVANKLLTAMERDAKRVMLAMMGFENRYGSWEVDHCNGRAGESPIGDISRTIFQDMAVRFVRQHQDEIFMLTKSEHDSILKSMRSEFKAKVTRHATEMASIVAKSWIDSANKALIAEFEKFDIFDVTTRLAKANAKKTEDLQ